MPRNRVEELENAVTELESTVEGLTEELVETKERVRILEAALDTEAPTRAPDRRAESDDPEGPDPTDGAESTEAEPDDVAEAAAEAAKGDEAQKGDDADVDDIIVA